jgi:excisionase family DNA binding protein
VTLLLANPFVTVYDGPASDRMGVADAAAYLGLDRSTIYRLCQLRRIRHRRLGLNGGRILLDREDLDAYLDTSVVEVGPPAEPFQFKHLRA